MSDKITIIGNCANCGVEYHIHSKDNWISVECELPEFDKKVLLYWEAKQKDGSINRYIEVGYLNVVRHSVSGRSPEFLGSQYEPIDALFWHSFPDFPNKE